MANAMRKIGAYLGLVDDPLDGDPGYSEERRLWPVPEPEAPMNTSNIDLREPPVQPFEFRPESAPVSAAAEPAVIHTIHPRSYNDAKRVGEEYRSGHPVIVNLTDMDDASARRIVDFAAGLTFGLRGTIERVTNKVFLLSPANVDVSNAPVVQQARDGFFNQS